MQIREGNYYCLRPETIILARKFNKFHPKILNLSQV